MRLRTIITTLMLIASVAMSAQVNNVQTDEYKNEVRQELNLDYSMPDYSVKKIDGIIIGHHLAQMLLRLQNNYNDAVYNQHLSIIVCNQNDGLDYVTIEDLKIQRISKLGDVITVISNAKLSKNPLGIKNTEIRMVFSEGVSDNKTVNSLFSDLVRYIKEE